MATTAAAPQTAGAGTGAAPRTGGELIVDGLIKAGVRHAFGIAGVHNLPVYDALARRGRIETLVTRHEQGAAFMADGYARVSGRPGVALVTTGPGLTNAVTPIAGSWSDSIPVLVVGTAGELPLLGKYKGYLHEYKDQHGVMEAAAGSRLVERTADLELVTLELLAAMQTGRPRPVTLEVPIDVLAGTATVEPAAMPDLPAPGRAGRGRHPAHGDPAARGALSAALRRRRGGPGRGERPAARAGRDPARPGAGLDQRQGGDPRHQPLVGRLHLAHLVRAIDGYPDVWRQADAGLVVGSRLTGMATRAWRLPLPARLAHLDVDPAEMGKSYPVEERLVGDARVGLELLLAELKRLGGTGASRWGDGEVRAARDADDAAGEEKCPEALTIVRGLREALSPEGILVCDQAIACYWAVRHYQVDGPSGASSTPPARPRSASACPSASARRWRRRDARSASWPATAGSSSPAPSWPPPCSTTCRWPSSSATTTPTA